jgi:hypothetical protein
MQAPTLPPLPAQSLSIAQVLVHMPPGNVVLQVRPDVQSVSTVQGEPICLGRGPASTGEPVSGIEPESSPEVPESIPFVEASGVVPLPPGELLLQATATTTLPMIDAKTRPREFAPAIVLLPPAELEKTATVPPFEQKHAEP